MIWQQGVCRVTRRRRKSRRRRNPSGAPQVLTFVISNPLNLKWETAAPSGANLLSQRCLYGSRCQPKTGLFTKMKAFWSLREEPGGCRVLICPLTSEDSTGCISLGLIGCMLCNCLRKCQQQVNLYQLINTKNGRDAVLVCRGWKMLI